MKNFFKSDVTPLLQSRLFVWLVLLFTTVGYGYFLTNPSISKDCFWSNVGSPCYTMVFQAASQYRWGWGLICWIPATFGLNVFAQGVLGLVAMAMGTVLTVSMLNKILSVRSVLFSALFCISILCFPLITEFCTYPTGLAVIGLGTGLSALAAIGVFLYLEEGNRSRWLAALAALTLSVSIYETMLFLFLILVMLFLAAAEIRGRLKVAISRVVFVVVSIVGVSVLLKFLISVGVTHVGRLFGLIPEQTMGQGAAMEIVWLGHGLLVGLRSLVHDIVRDLGLRSLTYLPILCFNVSVVAWVVISLVAFVRHRSWLFLLYSLGVVGLLFAMPVMQGKIIGYRVFLPSVAIFLAVEIYCLQFVSNNTARGLAAGLSLVLLTFLSSYLSTALTDVCERFAFDRINAVQLVNDINRFRGSDRVSPVVIVGRIHGEKLCESYPYGISYNGQALVQRSSWSKWLLQKRIIKASYIEGGYGGQGTLLDGDITRRHELYKFLNYVSAERLIVPDETMFDEVLSGFRSQLQPSFPCDGYISRLMTSKGEVIAINLGVYPE